MVIDDIAIEECNNCGKIIPLLPRHAIAAKIKNERAYYCSESCIFTKLKQTYKLQDKKEKMGV